ncbi:PilZ domain-containing protein [Qipengyuania gelatinilytica]|uniref:PilZ domain-containing protein n=1 Tax=Qipengyuania gelatinilytica TaxID=2867231 RepID=UPI001FFC606C|nr:PilZ domain-containing protein [Qipengyuania gelatinilytica]
MTDGVRDKRKAERLCVSAEVRCSALGSVTHDALNDISLGGCMLTGIETTLPTGTPVDIRLLKGVEVAGIVRWNAPGKIGVEFRDPLSKAALMYFTLDDMPAGNPVALDHFGRRLPPLSRLRGPA